MAVRAVERDVQAGCPIAVGDALLCRLTIPAGFGRHAPHFTRVSLGLPGCLLLYFGGGLCCEGLSGGRGRVHCLGRSCSCRIRSACCRATVGGCGQRRGRGVVPDVIYELTVPPRQMSGGDAPVNGLQEVQLIGEVWCCVSRPAVLFWDLP